jgi:hypothetical protein
MNSLLQKMKYWSDSLNSWPYQAGSCVRPEQGHRQMRESSKVRLRSLQLGHSASPFLSVAAGAICHANVRPWSLGNDL